MYDAYYFGCLHHPGHNWYPPLKPGYYQPWHVGALGIEMLFPAYRFDMQFAPPDANQRQGAARLSRSNNWTVLAWWDRSRDTRWNGNSAVVKRGAWNFADMMDCLATNWPEVMARQPASIFLVASASNG